MDNTDDQVTDEITAYISEAMKRSRYNGLIVIFLEDLQDGEAVVTGGSTPALKREDLEKLIEHIRITLRYKDALLK